MLKSRRKIIPSTHASKLLMGTLEYFHRPGSTLGRDLKGFLYKRHLECSWSIELLDYVEREASLDRFFQPMNAY